MTAFERKKSIALGTAEYLGNGDLGLDVVYLHGAYHILLPAEKVQTCAGAPVLGIGELAHLFLFLMLEYA